MMRAGTDPGRLAGPSPSFDASATAAVLLAIARSTRAVPAGYLTGERRR